MIRVTVNLEPLTRFAASLSETTKEGGPIHDALKQWARRYRGFLRERFDTFSKGGGDWKPLAKGTILARRAGRGKAKGVKTRGQQARHLKERATKLEAQAAKARAKGELVKADQLRAKAKGDRGKAKEIVSGSGVTILRDTGTLFQALEPDFGQPGQVEEYEGLGVTVGFGGPATHPEGKVTIADIAKYHQEGGPHLPARKIVVDPAVEVLNAMADDMDRAVRKMAKDAGAD